MFIAQDLDQLEEQGISAASFSRQLDCISHPKTSVKLSRNIAPEDGIIEINENTKAAYLNDYYKKIEPYKIVKFVPASGAATRMFKDLYADYQNMQTNPTFDELSKETSTFFQYLPQLAIYIPLEKSLAESNLVLKELLSKKDYFPVLDCLFNRNKLRYGQIPKALLPFHRYEDGFKTALEEQIEEAIVCVNSKQDCYIHFTVNEEFIEDFKDLARSVAVGLDVSFSTQSKATDTITFDTNNAPLRDAFDKLVFRPGGHGSLIDNLQKIDADIVLIKNIDNICSQKQRNDAEIYNKILIRILIEVREEISVLLSRFEKEKIEEKDISKAENLLKSKFFIPFEQAYGKWETKEKCSYLHTLLDRPLRVCGMVERTGEPGGGAFWVENPKGNISLQIVETSEINLQEPTQKEILETSLFFNPVHIACSTKNYRGEYYQLDQYIDYDRYFVSQKTQNGKTIKIIENPGLWNGAMSDWLTIFMSVPISTFSPVKTINDLTRELTIDNHELRITDYKI